MLPTCPPRRGEQETSPPLAVHRTDRGNGDGSCCPSVPVLLAAGMIVAWWRFVAIHTSEAAMINDAAHACQVLVVEDTPIFGTTCSGC